MREHIVQPSYRDHRTYSLGTSALRVPMKGDPALTLRGSPFPLGARSMRQTTSAILDVTMNCGKGKSSDRESLLRDTLYNNA